MYSYATKCAGRVHLCDRNRGRGDERWIVISLSMLQLTRRGKYSCFLLWAAQRQLPWKCGRGQEHCNTIRAFSLFIREFGVKCCKNERECDPSDPVTDRRLNAQTAEAAQECGRPSLDNMIKTFRQQSAQHDVVVWSLWILVHSV